MEINNEKGISLSITAIVVIAVGLVVMLVVLGYFVGGFGKTGESMQEVTSAAETAGGADEIGAGATGISQIWKGGDGDDCDEDTDCKTGFTCPVATKVCTAAV